MASFITTESPNTEQPYRFDDPTKTLILAALLCIIGFLGILGNTVVIIAVFISRKLQTSTNIFIANLAFSDFAASLMQPFQIMSLLNDGRHLPDSVCTMTSAIIYVSAGASIVNLGLIAFNRFYLITRPKSSYDRLYSRRNIVLMITFSWLYVILVVCGPPTFGFGKLGYSKPFRTCTLDPENGFTSYYVVFVSTLIQFLFMLVVFVCYVLIFSHLRETKRALVQSTLQNSTNDSSQANKLNRKLEKRQMKVTKNMFIIVCAYVFCSLPFAVARVFPVGYEVIPWVAMLAVLNSCVNPFIYGLNHPQFKEVFKYIATCKFQEVEQSLTHTKSVPHLNQAFKTESASL